jgi:hypothetical protein
MNLVVFPCGKQVDKLLGTNADGGNGKFSGKWRGWASVCKNLHRPGCCIKVIVIYSPIFIGVKLANKMIIINVVDVGAISIGVCGGTGQPAVGSYW